MRIGILTMNYISNYGGILQCVALQKTLENLGHEVEVICFSYSSRGTTKKAIKLLLTNFSSILQLVFNFICKKIVNKKRNKDVFKFSKSLQFIKQNINYTTLCDEVSIGTLIQKLQLDCIVIGSDKVWGAVSDNKLVYFGDWTPKFTGKIISYAACSSRRAIPKFNQNKLRRLLADFDAISVRDKHTLDLFQPYSNQKISIVADPTLLYDFQDYYDSKNDEPYILAYVLGKEIQGGHKQAIEVIRKSVGEYPVKVIVAEFPTDIVKYGDEIIYGASPAEWLNLIRHAAFVYTDSFHGVMFSLKFHKRFIAYYAEVYRASRLVDLQNKFNLQTCIVSSVEDMIERKSCDFIVNDSTYQRIKNIRDSSINFLRIQLGNCDEKYSAK